MGELITRIKLIFTQLVDQVQAAIQTADPGHVVGAVVDTVLPVACGVLRVLAVVVAIVVVVRCLLSLFRESPARKSGAGSPWPTAPGWTCTTGRTRWVGAAGPT